ncbi:MAG: SOS response-associated peptidase [Pseudomonadota bacterium]
MCGRFAVGNIDQELWSAWLETAEIEEIPDPRWNIAPTTQVMILRQDRVAVMARWGLVPACWRKPLALMKATTFNARSEEVTEKPMFRDAWHQKGRAGRCLVPAIGYYEWSGKKGAKTPWFVTTRRNRPGFCMAGLWAEAEVDGAMLRSCTILTTAAGQATALLHPRTPVILGDADWRDWLSGARGAELMTAPPDDQVDVWEVGPAVGKVQNDGPDLIERVGLGI